MRIEKCSFCGCSVYPGHGQMFVRNDCKVFRFCRAKCKKNFGLKRNPMRVRWTKTFRRAANKELTLDPSLEFEKRRCVPVRYNRDLTQATVLAMKRITEIKTRRAHDFWQKRMQVKVTADTKDQLLELRRNVDMVEDPVLREHAKQQLAQGEKAQAKENAKQRAAAQAGQKNRMAARATE